MKAVGRQIGGGSSCQNVPVQMSQANIPLGYSYRSVSMAPTDRLLA